MVLPTGIIVVPKHAAATSLLSCVFNTVHLVAAIFEHTELSNVLVMTMDCAL